MMKRLLKNIIPVLVLAVAGSAAGWHFYTAKADSAGPPALYGNVEIRDAQLAFKEQDRITSVLVDEGDRVSDGQLLARLDTERLKAQIDEANASIEAQAEVE